MEKLKWRHGVRNTALSLGLATLVTSPALAQTGSFKDTVKGITDQEPAPLPDVAAIERGESPSASASFPGLTRKAPPKAQADEPSAGAAADSESVTRSEAADESEDSSYNPDEGPPPEVPETHQVKKGDTLWSVCNFYFRDPYKWPQLWALNPQITNPHWIFTGDALRLKSGSGASLAVADASDLGPKVSQGAAQDGAVNLRETGFLSSADLVAAGKISGSREEKIMLSSGDSAYVAFPKDKRLVAGERYTVFTVDKDAPIRNPKDPSKIVGYLVKIYGDIVVNQVADDTSGRGTFAELSAPVERGYFISKRVQPFRRVKPVASDVSLEARIVASFAPRGLLAEQDFVVLSRGSKDGIKVGNRSYVIRKGDGYRPRMERDPAYDDGYPKEIVAQLLVVDVHEEAAVAWVERSTKEIQVGERTETRRGY
ncbi:MAG: LysM peptidoglycan-binding domain-containing protein [Deltaproteobacteria bacterium]|nr:LysM peptidoglycan-binding domain-containing protein [Deltaproteobacteria bacterium]